MRWKPDETEGYECPVCKDYDPDNVCPGCSFTLDDMLWVGKFTVLCLCVTAGILVWVL